MSKKDDEFIQMVAFFAVAAIILIYLNSTGIFKPTKQSVIGFSSISFQNININSQEQLLGVVSVDGGAESGQAILTDAVSANLISGGFTPGSKVTLTVEMENQNCGYNIDYYNEIIYGANLASARFESCSVNGINPCTQAGYALSACPVTRDPITNQQIDAQAHNYNLCYNFGDIPKYQKGYINPVPNIQWQIKVTLAKEGGESITKIIDPNNLEADFGSNIGKIKWIGNLQTNIACGSPTNKVLLRPINAQVWQEAPQSPYYNDYQLAYNLYQGSKGAIVPGWNAGNSLNAKLALLEAQLTGSYSNQIQQTPMANVVNPVLQLQLNANFLGIKAPRLAKAQIEKIQAPAILDNQQTIMSIDVKNIGSEQDSFDTSITCDKAITFSASRATIPVGQVVTIPMNVQGFAGDYFCTVKSTPVNAPDNFGQYQFSFTIQKPPCPSEFACCNALPAYRDKPCQDSSSVKSSAETIKDSEGNIIRVDYTSWIEIQHYSCGGTACSPTSTEILAGSQVIQSGSAATPSVTYQPTTQISAPSPTAIVIIPGAQGGIQAAASGDITIYIILCIIVIAVIFFAVSKKK